MRPNHHERPTGGTWKSCAHNLESPETVRTHLAPVQRCKLDATLPQGTQRTRAAERVLKQHCTRYVRTGDLIYLRLRAACTAVGQRCNKQSVARH